MKHYYRIGNEQHTNAIVAWDRINSKKAANEQFTFELVLDSGRFDHYNWSLPATKSIKILEEEFATKIRQQYEYVRVLYSGGSDSHSIVDAFLRSGNRIDEFVMYSWESMTDVCIDSPFNIAMKSRWLEDLHVKYNMPFTKLNVIQVDKKIHDDYFQKDWFLKYSGHGGTESFNVNHLTAILQYAKSDADRMTNTIDVMGMEKPRVFTDGNEIWFQMNDKNTMYSAPTFNDNIWFYLSADAPELIRAQCEGAIAVARSLFPSMSLDRALHVLQNDKRFYHEWCLGVGRITTRFQNSFVLMAKNVGQSLANSSRYHHVDDYAGERNNPWKQYEDYLNTATQLNGGKGVLPGIVTPRYVLEKICSK